jgi:hypothetical protein
LSRAEIEGAGQPLIFGLVFFGLRNSRGKILGF